MAEVSVHVVLGAAGAGAVAVAGAVGVADGVDGADEEAFADVEGDAAALGFAEPEQPVTERRSAEAKAAPAAPRDP
ncbi:hypothetical protein ACFWAR_34205 [Streptomyces sp. NPDC059917]|uniref:hypothetical protein n=1 Tax=Streptomyces sp. NPDC059917 TaxID=3347002 RepID=UPI00365696DF